MHRFITALTGKGGDWQGSPLGMAGLRRSQPLTDPSNLAPDRKVLG